MKPLKVGDSTAITLSGHVVFYHNGAVITCDSAIRYNSHLMECFNNVIINQKDTYIYGDKATYDGLTNIATVYSQLVKTVDKDATLYTYNFSFNTLDKIGYYTGGGTMSQGKNLMESTNGYYYTSTRNLVGVGDVEMRSPEYNIKSDSVSYNLDSEIAEFYTRSYIWNDKDEFLTANRGNYNRKTQTYKFTNDSYALTATQEVWADTIVYEQEKENALLVRNVQILDQKQRSMAFGEHAQYWGADRRGLLTQNPSVLSYDNAEQPDTVYMRSDSILIFTVDKVADSLKISADSLRVGDTLQRADVDDSLSNSHIGPPEVAKDSIAKSSMMRQTAQISQESEDVVKFLEIDSVDSMSVGADSHGIDGSLLKGGRVDLLHLKSVTVMTGVDSTKVANDSLVNVSKISKIEPDSTTAAADTVDRIVRAYRNVKIFRSDFQAVCDSLVGFSADSTIHLYINPVAWSESNQIKSEIIDIYTRNQTISKAVFVGDPIMSSRLDSLHFNQVKGKTMEAFFKDGNITRTDVKGNAQSYYFMEDGDSTDRYISGMMTVESADIIFYFQDKEIAKIVPKGNPAFVLFPIDKIPETQPILMKGFVWEEDRMITKLDVFDRTIRPSERSKYESMPKPIYGITSMIGRDKIRLMKDGAWFDRNDTLNEEAVEFLRTLGH